MSIDRPGDLVAVFGLSDDDNAIGAIQHHREPRAVRGRRRRRGGPGQAGFRSATATRRAVRNSPAPAGGRARRRRARRARPVDSRSRIRRSRQAGTPGARWVGDVDDQSATGRAVERNAYGLAGGVLAALVSPLDDPVDRAAYRRPGRASGERRLSQSCTQVPASRDSSTRRGRSAKSGRGTRRSLAVVELVVAQHADHLAELFQRLVRSRGAADHPAAPKVARARRRAGTPSPPRKWPAGRAGGRARRAFRGPPAAPRSGLRRRAGPGRPRPDRRERVATTGAPGVLGSARPRRPTRRRPLPPARTKVRQRGDRSPPASDQMRRDPYPGHHRGEREPAPLGDIQDSEGC